jgi:hypothetical protein
MLIDEKTTSYRTLHENLKGKNAAAFKKTECLTQI